MNYRIVNEQIRAHVIAEIQRLPLTGKVPTIVSIEPEKRKRSNQQNNLQRLWCGEIAVQMGESAEYWRGYCKLHFGVPIMRRDSPEFRTAYDKTVKPLDYETKLAIMCEPLDLPVTRLMTVRQKTEYLDEIQHHFAVNAGVTLSQPELLGYAA